MRLDFRLRLSHRPLLQPAAARLLSISFSVSVCLNTRTYFLPHIATDKFTFCHCFFSSRHSSYTRITKQPCRQTQYACNRIQVHRQRRSVTFISIRCSACHFIRVVLLSCVESPRTALQRTEWSPAPHATDGTSAAGCAKRNRSRSQQAALTQLRLDCLPAA